MFIEKKSKILKKIFKVLISINGSKIKIKQTVLWVINNILNSKKVNVYHFLFYFMFTNNIITTHERQ